MKSTPRLRDPQDALRWEKLSTHLKNRREAIMAVKQLAFEADARAGLLAGVEKLAAAVKSTLGPRGRNAILDKAGAHRQ